VNHAWFKGVFMATSGTFQKKLIYKRKGDFSGANWNSTDDSFTQQFYEQNLSQFWRPEDVSLQSDLLTWKLLNEQVKHAYSLNLLILTFLDTYQGDIGMPVVSRSIDDDFHQRKAVINWMAAMENAVHAKSYSNIFMTFLGTNEIDELFAWGKKNKNLQNIMNHIVGAYETLDQMNYLKKYNPEEVKFSNDDFKEAQWKAMVASVFLETWLFYSGFYYPLYFYGQGKLMQAGEIINLILRDEAIHGLYIGKLAIEIFNGFSKEKQETLTAWMQDLLQKLYKEQEELSETVYDPVDLTHDVKVFVRYNCNKALMNLGFEPFFEHEEVNPVVLNGLNTETKTMDYFSMKGNGYQKMKSVALDDDDFLFEKPKINK
jgi:ribonucleoside-diphosphate reductase beta chain